MCQALLYAFSGRFESSISFLISSTFQAEVLSDNFTDFGYLPSVIPLYRDERLTGMMPGLSPSPMVSRRRRKPMSGMIFGFISYCGSSPEASGNLVEIVLSCCIDELPIKPNAHIFLGSGAK